MAERVVSVKMPASLVAELRKLTAEHHYLDLSEQLRSVVRQKCMRTTSPPPAPVEREVRDAQTKLQKEKLLKELARMLEEGR
jgi:Arc/MetJ-type ribon-helix-helix transcriptional regulator